MRRARIATCVLWFSLAALLAATGCRRGSDAKQESESAPEEQATEQSQTPKDLSPQEEAEPAERTNQPAPPAAPRSSANPRRSAPAPRRPSSEAEGSAAAVPGPARPSESAAPAPPSEDLPSRPSSPPTPEVVEVTVPQGTVLELELLTSLDSSLNRVGDEIQARTLSPVFVKGDEVLPKGTYVEGRVTQVQPSGRVKGKAMLGFTFDRLSTPTGVETIKTTFVEKEARSTTKKDAKVIGGGAGVGALIGGILGGKKGAAIGATIGGAGGTGVVLSTKGEEIRIPVGAEIHVRLDEPVILAVN